MTKAFFRAGKILRFTQKELASLYLSPLNTDGRIAFLFLQVFQSLDTLFGGCEADMRKWFNSQNRYLQGVPRDYVKSLPGLLNIASYLDAMRGQI